MVKANVPLTQRFRCALTSQLLSMVLKQLNLAQTRSSISQDYWGDINFFVKLHIIQKNNSCMNKINLAAEYRPTFKNIFFTFNFSSTKIRHHF